MTITKFGHSCLLVEENGVRILIDPGSYSAEQTASITHLDAILITHVHFDHCDIPSIKTLIKHNPSVVIITNPQVKEKLAGEGIEARVLGDGERMMISPASLSLPKSSAKTEHFASVPETGVLVEGFGTDHIEIHSSLQRDKNVGFLIANRLFHPGDSYTIPTKPVDILALPIGGPWCKIGEAIDYALAVKPKLVIPIHDAMFADPARASKWPATILNQHGIEVRILEPGQSTEI